MHPTLAPGDRSRASAPRAADCILLVALIGLLGAPLSPATAQAPDGAVVHGQVLDTDGAPLAGARVHALGTGRSTETDSIGAFRIEGLPGGAVTLRISWPGARAEEVRIDLPRAGPLRVVLARAYELPGVIATATPLRRGASYQPAGAYDAEALQRRAATSIGEMLRDMPGVSMRSMGPAPARPVIRGLDGDRVVVLENGQRMGDISATAPDHAIALDPLQAERIEVVRGPASLLYGSSALGGVVNVLREDRPRDWSTGTSGRMAAQGATANGSGAASAQLVHGGERWAGAGRFTVRSGRDFRTPGGILPGTYGSSWSAGGGVGFVGRSVDAGASLDLLSHVYGVPEEIDDPDEEVEIRMSRQSVRTGATWTPGGAVEEVDVSIAGARFFQQELERERGPGGWDEDVEHEFLRHTVSATATVRHPGIGGRGDGAVGANLLWNDLRATGEEEFTPDADAVTAALFVYQEIPLLPRLRLQLGGRIEARGMSARPNETFPGFSDRRTSATLSGSAGINLRPSERLEIGTQVARAHRAPLIEELWSDGPHLGTARYEIGEPGLRDEIGYGIDVFARGASGRLRWEAAGFVNRIDDFVVLRPTGARDPASDLPVWRYGAERALLIGAEASLETSVARHWEAEVSADVVRGDRIGDDRAPLPFMPPARATLALRYDRIAGWAGARTRLAAAQTRVAGEDPTEGYAVLDAEIGARVGRAASHVLVVRLDNVFDTAYRDHLSRVEGRRHPMPGRGLNLVYRWTF